MAVTNKAGEVEYAGRVLVIGQETYQAMSDVWETVPVAHCWDGEKVVRVWCYYGEKVATVDATEDVRAAAAEWYAEQETIRRECRATEAVIRRAYGFRQGQTVRAVAGRKVPVGSVVELTTGEMPSAYDRYGFVVHVRDLAGNVTRYCDAANFEVMPDAAAVSADAGETQLRCPCCKQVRPVADYLYSPHAGFGRRRYVGRNDGVECLRCAAADLSGFQQGTAGHILAVAVLAGDLTAVCPLIDELIADGNDYRADELKRLHKLDKPARKSRKKKAEPAAV